VRIRGAEALWRLFASVKTAIIILSSIALTAALGSAIPQENAIPVGVDPAAYYAQTYGTFGASMHRMGLTHMYTSSWFLSLLTALFASLVVCSWERIGPLVTSLRTAPVKRSRAYICAQPLSVRVARRDDSELRLAAALRAHKYDLEAEGSALRGERGRTSRYGPYVIHIGLLVVIAGAFMRVLPGLYQDFDVVIPERATVRIPESPFSIRNNGFHISYYADGRARSYETNATFLAKGKPQGNYAIRVNHPLQAKGFSFYQESYLPREYDWALYRMTDNPSGVSLGHVRLNLRHLQKSYPILGHGKVLIHAYYPDFQIVGNQVQSLDTRSTNPVLRIEYIPVGKHVGKTTWLFVAFPHMQLLKRQGGIVFTQVAVASGQTTVLRAHRDAGTPVVFIGLGISLVGLYLCFYRRHRMIYAVAEGDSLYLCAVGHKYVYGLDQELSQVLKTAQLTHLQSGEGNFHERDRIIQ